MSKKLGTLDNIKSLRNEIVDVKDSLKAVKIVEVKAAVEAKKKQFKSSIQENLQKMEEELIGRTVKDKAEDMQQRRLREIYDQETSEEDQEEDLLSIRIKALHKKRMQRLGYGEPISVRT